MSNCSIGYLKENFLDLGTKIGDLVECLRNPSTCKETIAAKVSLLFSSIISICYNTNGMCIMQVVRNKLAVNRKKYQLDLVKKDSVIQKYTNYTAVTGISGDNDYIVVDSSCFVTGDMYGHSIRVMNRQFYRIFKSVSDELFEFVTERNWIGKYSCADISVCLFAEFGELVQTVEWKPDRDVASREVLEGVGRECADVTIYLLHLCRIKHIEIKQICLVEL